MNYWLMKSEPEAYSIEDLRRDKTTGWGGVRNYSARNNMKAMKKGDRAFFYHSNAEPSAIAGIMEISKEAHPDPEDPLWVQVSVKFVEVFEQPLSLQDLKKIPALKNMALFKYSRLSVQPVTEAEWKTILKLAKGS